MKKPLQSEQPTARRLTAADVDIINREVDEWHANIVRMKEAILAGDEAQVMRWARVVCGLPPQPDKTK